MPKKYKVKTTEFALNQIIGIKKNIENELKAPDTANIWLKHIKDSLKSLTTFPARFPIIEEKILDVDIHRLVLGNHLVYYWIDEENQRVWVIAVLYARRDQLRELKNLII